MPDVNAALILTNEKVVVDADNAPAPTLDVRKLKDFIRKTAKGKPISSNLVDDVKEVFSSEN